MIDRHGCVKALATLDRVPNEKPEQYHEEVVEVLRCLVVIRDHLIEQRRRSEPSAELDERLDHINAVLSVMTSGSFPVVGLNHERLKRANGRSGGRGARPRACSGRSWTCLVWSCRFRSPSGPAQLPHHILLRRRRRGRGRNPPPP
jgi:hypothetical protein